MTVIKDVVVPLGRPVFVPKDGKLTLENLEIESSGAYVVIEKEDHFVIKNDECCRSIQLKVSTRD